MKNMILQPRTFVIKRWWMLCLFLCSGVLLAASLAVVASYANSSKTTSTSSEEMMSALPTTKVSTSITYEEIQSAVNQIATDVIHTKGGPVKGIHPIAIEEYPAFQNYAATVVGTRISGWRGWVSTIAGVIDASSPDRLSFIVTVDMDRSVLGAEVTLIKVPKEQVRSLKLWQEQGDEQVDTDFAINAIGNGDEQLIEISGTIAEVTKHTVILTEVEFAIPDQSP